MKVRDDGVVGSCAVLERERSCAVEVSLTNLDREDKGMKDDDGDESEKVAMSSGRDTGYGIGRREKGVVGGGLSCGGGLANGKGLGTIGSKGI